MSETLTERPPVFVVRFRGGPADGVFRLAVGRVACRIVIERDGRRREYEYAGPEDQLEHTNVYNAGEKRNVRVSRVAAVYHIFRPVAEVRP